MLEKLWGIVLVSNSIIIDMNIINLVSFTLNEYSFLVLTG